MSQPSAHKENEPSPRAAGDRAGIRDLKIDLLVKSESTGEILAVPASIVP